MNNLTIQALIAGLIFGIWPILLNNSGLNGKVSGMVFSFLVFAALLPFTYRELWNMPNVRWSLVFTAAAIGAVGIGCFNNMLSKASTQNIGVLLALTAVVQTPIPASYQIATSGGSVSLMKCLRFVFAGIGVVFLLKG